jgi:hypothetical protein
MDCVGCSGLISLPWCDLPTSGIWEHREHPESSVDVLIVDEAHRVRAKSQPKVVAARRPKISQLEEIVRAAKVTVLFMDQNQIIQPDETGDPQQVSKIAKRLGVRLLVHNLRAQLRCDGSGEYLRWTRRPGPSCVRKWRSAPSSSHGP